MDNIRVEETYPYNLLTEVFMGEIEWVDDDDHNAGLDKALSTLFPRESEILRMRFVEKKTLNEVGKELGVTGERIRQQEAKGIWKLRHPTRKNYILFGLNGYEKYLSLNSKEIALREREKELDERWENLRSILKRLKPIMDELFPAEETPSEKPEKLVDDYWIDKPIEELNMTVRAFNCLKRAGNNTVGELCKYVEGGKLISTRNMGRVTVEEVLMKLKGIGKDYTDIY